MADRSSLLTRKSALPRDPFTPLQSRQWLNAMLPAQPSTQFLIAWRSLIM
jgi:hypothetical protein